MFPEGYQAPPANPGNGDSGGGGYDGSLPPDYPPLQDDDEMPEGHHGPPDGDNEGQPPLDGEPEGLLVRNQLGIGLGHP